MELTQKQIDYCMECGVCTGSCPVSRVLPSFSPRQMIKRAVSEPDGDISRLHEIWACLSCGRCSNRCPVEIDFPEFLRAFRVKAREDGNLPFESHHGIMQAIADLQTGDVRQRRTDWAEAGTFAEKGDYFYFVGCLPYFDVIFSYLNISPLQSARGVLAILNRLGMTPVISDDERCCGHDALWSGNEETFRKLAKHNLEVIAASGAKTVLFSCPEGYTTFRDYYPRYFGDLPFEVIHMTEFLARELPGSGVSFKPSQNGAVTYHDPCRLGRGSGLYEQPRDLIKLIPDSRVTEMGRNRENALCCGTSAWMECSSCSKAMRIERLNEALQTGAHTLITACPKCHIHLTCAQGTAELDVKVTDLYTYLSKGLEGPKEG
jgi:heterodisulfide reductase subunit D